MQGLIAIEIARSWRWRLLVPFGVVAMGCLQVYRARDGLEGQLLWFEVYRGSAEFLLLMLPLLVAVACGTSTADDRRTGFSALELARGATSRQLLIARFLVTAAVGAVVGAVAVSVPLGMAYLVGPRDAPGLGVPPLGPSFSSSSTLVVCAAWIGLAAVAGGVFGMTSVALGLITTNAFAVLITPGVLHVIASLLLFRRTGALGTLNPMDNLTLGSPRVSPVSVTIFWSALFVSVGVLGAVALKARGGWSP